MTQYNFNQKLEWINLKAHMDMENVREGHLKQKKKNLHNIAKEKSDKILFPSLNKL